MATLIQKQVRFSPETKSYDGIHHIDQQYEQLVEMWFSYVDAKGQSASDAALETFMTTLATQDVNTKEHMRRRLRAVLNAIATCGKSPLLPTGGGKNYKLGRVHRQALLKLLCAIAKAAQ